MADAILGGPTPDPAALTEQARFPEMNPGPVLRVELDSKIILDNAAARRAFGEDPVGRYWRDICPGLDDLRWAEILAAAEAVYIEAAVGDRQYAFAHRPDPGGRLVFVYGIDVTQQRLAERTLAE